MGCKKLYLEHMDVLACTAAVTACTPRRDGGFDVETDRTPLFPEGGGQRSDVGMMDGARILHCREENGTVLHTVEKPFAPGSTVRIEADGAVRRLHTQQHTGEHLLSFAYRKLFGAENIGFHMSASLVTIDLDRMLTEDEIAAGEAYANELVWSDRAVRIFTVDASALDGLPLRKKNETLTGDVRIVEIEGGEMCTCCGTHFTHTAPVGLIKVLEHARYKQGCRVTFVCGALALRHFAQENRELRRTAAQLSAKPDAVFDAVCRKEAQLSALQAALRQQNAQLAALYAEKLAAESTACAGFRLIAAVLPAGAEVCRAAAERLSRADDVFVVLLSAEDGGFGYVCMAGANCPLDCRTAAKKLREAFGARGGGSERAAQGRLSYAGEPSALLREIREVMADGGRQN
ncbi:MAG: DHHA1 domain-containing protein [Acutalibacteraceae bacterium]